MMASVLAVLSAMITPAVLISACASLTISTSNRLARAMDRTRKLSSQLRDMFQGQVSTAEHGQMMFTFEQIQMSVRRARLLHRALAALYAALGVFIATSIAIGVIQLTRQPIGWLPTALSMFGVGLLLYASLLLGAETIIARRAIDAEMALIVRLGRGYLPSDMLDKAANDIETS